MLRYDRDTAAEAYTAGYRYVRMSQGGAAYLYTEQPEGGWGSAVFPLLQGGKWGPALSWDFDTSD